MRNYRFRLSRYGLGFLLIVCLLAGWSGDAGAREAPLERVFSTTPQQPTAIALQPVITSGLEAPVYLIDPRDGSSRLFIVEEPGRIRIYSRNTSSLLSTPFLDITSRVLYGGEQGLLSVAFPPGYASKGYFYVYYTNKSGDNVVVRFHLTGNPNIADPNSAETILYLSHPANTNHNGGLLLFGPDGYLYIGTGDGGGSGDPAHNAQNPGALLGKILRIDVEPLPSIPVVSNFFAYLPAMFSAGNPNSNPKYRIPPTNPYANTPGYRPEIWALGMRNPWRYSFDASNGDLFIGDVGQGAREEIDYQPHSSPGGENYGWNKMEGFLCYGAATCSQAGLTLPVFDYPHQNGQCSITGGFVYHGGAIPSLEGTYIYADYCTGTIWGLTKSGSSWNNPNNEELLNTPHNVSSFGEDSSGELYLLDLSGGGVYKIVAAQP